MSYVTKTIAVSVCPAGDDPLVSEKAFHIKLCDDGGGVFVEIQELMQGKAMTFDAHELEPVFMAAKKLIKSYEENEDAKN